MRFQRILVTGGAGYVGAELVPYLVRNGRRVVVLDWFLYEPGLFSNADPRFITKIIGDIRDRDTVRSALKGVDAVIHLAAISNDPSADLDPALTEDVNQTGFALVVEECIRAKIQRFIFASSASVYGLSDARHVTEDHPRVPISAYNKSKMWAEDHLAKFKDVLPYVIVRPATICGYSRRQRLDLVINLLTAQAVTYGWIKVLGGAQFRPYLHIKDCISLYNFLLHDSVDCAGETFNVSHRNVTVDKIAIRIKDVLDWRMGEIEIRQQSSNDPRSYRVSSNKLFKFGFSATTQFDFAVSDLYVALVDGRLGNMELEKYHNLKMLKKVQAA